MASFCLEITAELLSLRCFGLLLLLLYVGLPSGISATCQRDRITYSCHWEDSEIQQSCNVIDPRNKVRCNYRRINNIAEFEGLFPIDYSSVKFPNKAKEFAILLYTFEVENVLDCGLGVRFSWKLPHDGSVEWLKGFLLNITYENNGTVNILRIFNVETTNLVQDDLLNVVFSYECIVLMRNTKYRFELISLPRAPSTMQKHNLIYLHTEDEVVDANNSARWKAAMWVTPSLVDGSIKVCFSTAPAHFGFSMYDVFLVTRPMLLIRVQQRLYHVNQSDLFMCHNFTELCPEIYRIEIEPVSLNCNCKLESNCAARCSYSVFENADLTNGTSCSSSSPPSVSIPVPSAVGPFKDFLTVPKTEPTPPSPPQIKLVGILIGSILGIAFLVLLGFLVWMYHKNKSCKALTIQLKKKEIHRKRIVLLYSSNVEENLDVVRCLADLLRNPYCRCDVICDPQWQQDNGESDRQEMWKQIVASDYTLFIMSDEGHERYKKALKGEIYPATRRNSAINQLVVTMLLQLMSNINNVKEKCFQVCLPNTICHLVTEVEGRYCLPEDLEKLLEALLGVRNFDRKRQINKSKEKRKLEQAIGKILAIKQKESVQDDIGLIGLQDPMSHVSFLDHFNESMEDEIRHHSERSEESGFISLEIFSSLHRSCATSVASSNRFLEWESPGEDNPDSVLFWPPTISQDSLNGSQSWICSKIS